MLINSVAKKEVDLNGTKGDLQRLALPVSRSTYVIEEQQAEFGIGAPGFFYLFFFAVVMMAMTRNFLLVALVVGIQGFILRNLLHDKPKNFLLHLLGYPFMTKHFVHRCKDKVAMVKDLKQGSHPCLPS